MKIGNVEIKWLGHDGFFIKKLDNGKIIYIDPYNISDNLEKADLILITHGHYDHCSVADIEKIIKDGTKILATADCQSKIARFDIPIQLKIVEPNQEIDFGSIRISTIPAYNVDKHFHPKEEHWVGYLVKMNGVIIYHTGDCDLISEMQKLTGHKQPGKEFVALLPVSGRFVMNSEEAAKAAKILKPSIAIPMHYGSIVGTEEDAQEFVEICKEEGINAKILEKE
jgi:L-ascorbate metabolism protein UlaG (beta-lactamase superfamily)